MIPLTRDEHDRAQENDPWTLTFLELNARRHLVRMYERYRYSGRYLGPDELVEQVHEWALEDARERRLKVGMGVTWA